MRSSGAETLQAALRRALWFIIALVIVGVVAWNVASRARGPEYQAEARVLLNPSELTPLLTDTQPGYVDPERVEERALALAKSPDLYKRVSAGLGDAEELQDAVRVSAAEDDILTFTATTDDPERSRDIANAVSDAYVDWRVELSGEEITKGLNELRAKLRARNLTTTRREALEERLSEFELLQSLNDGNARRIETADSAVKTSPALMRDSMLGGAIGLTIALLLVGVREALDTKVRSEDDVEELLNVPVLATLPRLPRRSSIVMFGRHEMFYADSYALLAANLAQAMGGQRTTMLAVTSAVAGEGKTSTAANLAIALARRQEDVILADFDVRNPTLAEVFRLPKRGVPGLAHLMVGNAELPETLWAISLDGAPSPTLMAEASLSGNGRPGEGSLRLLPAGGHLQQSSLAESPYLEDVLTRLKGAAGLIVLDTPPALLTVEMAELSHTVDQVLVVVRHGRVARRSLRALGRQLQNWSAPVAGACLTDAPAQESAYTYRHRTN
jgi:Mrp family chromosome partitioning ATPase